MLTRCLLDQAYQLSAVEADEDMVNYLQAHFPTLKDRIVAGDFLKMSLPDLMQHRPFGLIGNFPYNISTQILFKMLDHRELIPQMVGMFQKEVAGRVVAGPGSKIYGITSVLIQAFYRAECLFTVEKHKFNPPPKVQSAVIRLTRLPEPRIHCDEALFRKIVKQTFGQRRKMLRNTLKPLITDPAVLENDLLSRRPEQLSVEEFEVVVGMVAGER